MLPTSTLVTSRFDGSNPGAPSSSLRAFSAVSGRDQRRHWIARALRIGDMTLLAVHGDDDIEAAAAAVLDHVADAVLAGRFADQAMIERLALGRERIEHSLGAVDGRALFVAGEQKRDRARSARRATEIFACAATMAAIAVFMSAAPRP